MLWEVDYVFHEPALVEILHGEKTAPQDFFGLQIKVDKTVLRNDDDSELLFFFRFLVIWEYVLNRHLALDFTCLDNLEAREIGLHPNYFPIVNLLEILEIDVEKAGRIIHEESRPPAE